jgi:hypothetical protein
MKTASYAILATLTGSIILFCCEKDKSKQLTLTGKLVSTSECKSSKLAYLETSPSDTVTCVEFLFDGPNNKLSIDHLNAGFNCCNEGINCNVSLNNDTIIIQESEKSSLCDCDCLFDLNIEIDGVDSKLYQIKFIEPYSGNQNKINFAMDLTKHNEGSYCVTRKQYPWGTLYF